MAESTEATPTATTTVADHISVTATAEYDRYPHSSEQACWAIASFKAPFYEPTSRAPVDIVAVIDKSGSMAGKKLELVKKTLEFVVDQLKECDRLALVTYDSNVYLDFQLTKMTKREKESVRRSIKSIRDGSSTNLCGGLLKGMEQIALTQDGEKATVQSVLLLTDGLANQGHRTKEAILEQMRKMQDLGLGAVDLSGMQPESQGLLSGIRNWFSGGGSAAVKANKSAKFNGTVYTFGFGSDHDSNLLEAISTQGGGVYYYIDTNEKIPESFADCLGGLLSVVGQNLSFKLEALGENTMTAVHANRAINWTTANKSCEIPMGDLQSEEERDIVLELKLPALSAPEVDKVIKATLSYFNIITSELDTVTHELTIKREDGEQGPANEAVDTQKNRMVATNALKDAENLADQGKLDDAKKVLQDAIATLEQSLTGKQEFCQALISDLKRSLESMKSRDSYLGHGKLYMHSRWQSHAVQRSNYVDDDEESSSYYLSDVRKAYRSAAKK